MLLILFHPPCALSQCSGPLPLCSWRRAGWLGPVSDLRTGRCSAHRCGGTIVLRRGRMARAHAGPARPSRLERATPPTRAPKISKEADAGRESASSEILCFPAGMTEVITRAGRPRRTRSSATSRLRTEVEGGSKTLLPQVVRIRMDPVPSAEPGWAPAPSPIGAAQCCNITQR